MKRGPVAEDITGQVYNGRIVVGREWNHPQKFNKKYIYWRVRCLKCGCEGVLRKWAIKNGHGCQKCYLLDKERAAKPAYVRQREKYRARMERLRANPLELEIYRFSKKLTRMGYKRTIGIARRIILGGDKNVEK